MIKIEIEKQEAIERIKKDKSGNYYVQTAWAYTYDRDGRKKRFPEEIEIFVQRDDRGTPLPLPAGDYKISPQSVRVKYRSLELGFLQLEPLKKTA